MKVYKITPGEDLNPCCEKNIDAILAWIESSEIGDKIIIDIIEMSEEKLDSLPEYEGP